MKLEYSSFGKAFSSIHETLGSILSVTEKKTKLKRPKRFYSNMFDI